MVSWPPLICTSVTCSIKKLLPSLTTHSQWTRIVGYRIQRLLVGIASCYVEIGGSS